MHCPCVPLAFFFTHHRSPTLTLYLQGLTYAYPRIENIGLPMYCVYFFLYMVSVEFGVYWMHRGLHEIKWAYK